MQEAVAIALHNLAWWSFGFLCGWCARRAAHRAVRYVAVDGGPMRWTDRREALVAAGTTLVIVALVAGAVALAEMYGDAGALQDFWNTCRHVNYPLGVIVACGVVYRIVLMAFDRPRWRDPQGVHLLLWFVHIAANLLAAAMTSHHYELTGTDATWVSGLRTVLMGGAVVLTIWWPHPQRHAPIKESR